MFKIHHTYKEILNTLDQLPSPKRGHIRVYRGQTKDFGKMIPSGLRGDKVERRILWNLYSHIISEDLLSQLGSVHQSKIQNQNLNSLFLWVYAIAQHYGPGSNFLDVTHSLEVALWFALHQAEKFETTAVIGDPGLIDFKNDLLINHCCIKYTSWPDEPGYLYVFDVPKWSGKLAPNHGELLDLAEAPKPFSSCKRIIAQKACLLSSKKSVNKGDLSSYYACEPLRVVWPIKGDISIDSPAEYLFPPPKHDDWYAKFLSIPVTLKPRPEKNVFCFELPLEIPQYLSDDPNILIDLYSRGTAIKPPLFYLELTRDLPKKGIMKSLITNYFLAKATPILLEGPLLYSTPPISSDMWNESILSDDLDDAVDVIDQKTQQKAGSVSLRNVFIEFSTLEKSGWERVESSGESIELIRGIWILRRSDYYIINVFNQIFPSGHILNSGPLLVRYNRNLSRFQLVNNWKDRQDLNQLDKLAKPFYAALTLFRDLSTKEKPSPYPLFIFDKKKAMIRMAGSVSCLITHQGAFGYNFIRQSRDLDEPYLGPGSIAADSTHAVFVKLEEPFSEINAQNLRTSIDFARKN